MDTRIYPTARKKAMTTQPFPSNQGMQSTQVQQNVNVAYILLSLKLKEMGIGTRNA